MIFLLQRRLQFELQGRRYNGCIRTTLCIFSSWCVVSQNATVASPTPQYIMIQIFHIILLLIFIDNFYMAAIPAHCSTAAHSYSELVPKGIFCRGEVSIPRALLCRGEMSLPRGTSLLGETFLLRGQLHWKPLETIFIGNHLQEYPHQESRHPHWRT